MEIPINEPVLSKKIQADSELNRICIRRFGVAYWKSKGYEQYLKPFVLEYCNGHAFDLVAGDLRQWDTPPQSGVRLDPAMM